MRAGARSTGMAGRTPVRRVLVPATLPLVAAALLLVAADSAPVAAQTISGRVLEEGRERPVPGAIVRLVDPDGETRAQTASDAGGAFRLSPPEPGEYVLEATALGYEATRSPLLALGVEGEASLELMVRAAPMGLEGFEVSVEAEAEAYLGTIGVTPSSLRNRWIDREEIEEMETPGLVKDVIRWQNIAGVHVDEYDATALDAPLCVRFQRRIRACAITVLDGIVVPPETAFNIVADDIEAVAILDPTDAATFYGTQGGGGAVLIWTRVGGR